MVKYLDEINIPIKKKWKLIEELILMRMDSDDILYSIYNNLNNSNEEIDTILNSNIDFNEKRYMLVKNELELLYNQNSKNINILDRLSGWNLLDICFNGYYRKKGQNTFFSSGEWIYDKNIYKLLVSYGLQLNKQYKRKIISNRNNKIVRRKSKKKMIF